MISRILAATLLALPAAAARAEDAGADSAPAAIGLYFEEGIPLTPAPTRTIQEEISVDLIDLQALESAIQNQPGFRPIRMTLEDCLIAAIRQNDDVLIAGVDPLRAEADIFSARGEFDPILQGRFLYSRSSVAASQQLLRFGGISNIESYNTQLNGTLLGKTPYGQQYALSFDVNKEETTFGNFIEEFDTLLTMTITQPLLRGFGKKVNTVRVLAAKNARGAAELQLRLTLMNTASDVVKAYWDLVGAVDNWQVRRTSLSNAERLLEINETRREIGTAADIEVLQAKAGVATRQSELIAARAQVATASDALKRVIGLRDGDLFSPALVVPTDRPEITVYTDAEVAASNEQVDVSIARALAKRPELRLAELEIDNAELDAVRARNEMLPQLDVSGSYGAGGRDHKVRQALKKTRERENYVYSLGIQGQVSLGNRAARGAYQRAKLTERQAELRLEKMRQDIMLNVHIAARNMLTNKILVESNRQASRLQQANVVAEEKRLRLGVTTSWQVLKVQEDLTLSETQLVQALIAYEKARVDLLLAEGSLLEEFGVDFALPDSEAPIGYFHSVAPRWAPDDTTRADYWRDKGMWFHDPHLPRRPGEIGPPDRGEAADMHAVDADAAPELLPLDPPATQEGGE